MKTVSCIFAIMAMAVLGIVAYPTSQAPAVGPDKTLAWQGGGSGRVVFEGKEHAEKGYGCKDCHPGIFSMKQGAAKITMAAMNRGELCGACHNGRVAFATSDMSKCHECHGRQEQHRENEGHREDDRHEGHKRHHDDDH